MEYIYPRGTLTKDNGENMFTEFLNDERGQGITEYVIIIALIAIATIFAIKVLGAEIKDLIVKSNKRIKDDTSGFESG